MFSDEINGIIQPVRYVGSEQSQACGTPNVGNKFGQIAELVEEFGGTGIEVRGGQSVRPVRVKDCSSRWRR